jgi:hypothetical protein
MSASSSSSSSTVKSASSSSDKDKDKNNDSKEKKGIPSKASSSSTGSSSSSEKKERTFTVAKFAAPPDWDKVDCCGKWFATIDGGYKVTAADRKLKTVPDYQLNPDQLDRKRKASDFADFEKRAIMVYDYNRTFGVVGARKSFKGFLRNVLRHSKERSLFNTKSVFLNQKDPEEAEEKKKGPQNVDLESWRTETEQEFIIRLQTNEQDRELDLETLMCDACGADIHTGSETENVYRYVCRHPDCQDPENFYFCTTCVENRTESEFKCLKALHPLMCCDLHPDAEDLLNSNDPEELSDIDESKEPQELEAAAKVAEASDTDGDKGEDGGNAAPDVFVGWMDSSNSEGKDAAQDDEAEMKAAMAAALPLVPASLPPPIPVLPKASVAVEVKAAVADSTITTPLAPRVPRVIPKMSVKERLSNLNTEYLASVAAFAAPPPPPSATTTFTQTLTTTVTHPAAEPPVFKSMADVSKALSKPSFVYCTKLGRRGPVKRPAPTSSSQTAAAPQAKRQKTDVHKKTA